MKKIIDHQLTDKKTKSSTNNQLRNFNFHPKQLFKIL